MAAVRVAERPAIALSIAGLVILLTTRLDPVWLLAAGVMLGGLGRM